MDRHSSQPFCVIGNPKEFPITQKAHSFLPEIPRCFMIDPCNFLQKIQMCEILFIDDPCLTHHAQIFIRYFNEKSIVLKFWSPNSPLRQQKPPIFGRLSFSYKTTKTLDLQGFHQRAPGRTRTGDLRITNALLYQLSHGSTFKKCCCITQQQVTCPGIEPGFTP